MHEPIYYEIGLEYHGVPEKLITKLTKLGYKVSFVKRKLNSRAYKEIGILHAILRR
jgi:hypothetical protein